MAYQGVMLSMPVCHLGGFFGGLGLPSFRYCRIAISVSPTPTVEQVEHYDVVVVGGGSAGVAEA